MAAKRTIDNFFQPSTAKKARMLEPASCPTETIGPSSDHSTYPFPVPDFPSTIRDILSSELPASSAKEINDQPDLDLLYFQPYIPQSIENTVFEFLRQELFFYRVKYKIKRGAIETDINTPRLYVLYDPPLFSNSPQYYCVWR